MNSGKERRPEVESDNTRSTDNSETEGASWTDIDSIKNAEVLDLFLSQFEYKLKADLDSVDGLDTKASILAGIVATMLIVLGAVTPKKPLLVFSVLLLAAVIFFILSICLSLISYWPRTFRLSPDPLKLISGYSTGEISFIKKNILRERAEDFQKNAKIIAGKKKYLALGVIALLGGVISVAIAVAIKLFS